MSRLSFSLPGPEPVSTSSYGSQTPSYNIGGFGKAASGPVSGSPLPFPSPVMGAPATGAAGAGGAGTGYQMRQFPSAQLTMDDVPELQQRAGTLSTSGSNEDGGGFFGSKFWGDDGFNLGSVQALAGTIGAFGNIWNGMQQNKLANEALEFKKDAYETNMRNQKKTFNLGLEDRIRARYAQQGRSSAAADDYISKHRMGD